MKTVKLSDFLTQRQIKLAMKLKTARQIHDEVIKPNIKAINKVLGQENDPMYLAYAVEYAIGQYKMH
jgi:hypothetical protein